MAAGATDEDVAQTVRQLEAHRLPCEVVVSDEEFSTDENVLGNSKMDIEGQEAVKRSLSNAFTVRKRLAKEYKPEGEEL